MNIRHSEVDKVRWREGQKGKWSWVLLHSHTILNFVISLERHRFVNFNVDMRGGGATLGRNIDVKIGRSAWKASSVRWNLGTNSAFALGLKKPRKIFHQAVALDINFVPQKKNTTLLHYTKKIFTINTCPFKVKLEHKLLRMTTFLKL
jgi:hypothetical protein